MGRAAPKRHYTAAEYRAPEAQSEVRHEFSEGEIFAGAGAGIAHNTIAGNFFMLRQSLRGKKCWAQMEAMRLAVQENQHYTYLNVLVSCDPSQPARKPATAQPGTHRGRAVALHRGV